PPGLRPSCATGPSSRGVRTGRAASIRRTGSSRTGARRYGASWRSPPTRRSGAGAVVRPRRRRAPATPPAPASRRTAGSGSASGEGDLGRATASRPGAPGAALLASQVVPDTSFIPPAKPEIGEAEIEAAVRVLRSGMVVQGPEVKGFEEEFSA